MFFPDNSTCTFCDSISFVETKTSWFGPPRETVVADAPDDWFKYLAGKQTLGVRLVHHMQHDPQISDRMSAGFVGGGGRWMLTARHHDSTDYWMARWQVWNQNAPEKRIWRVTYGLVATEPPSPVHDDHGPEAFAAFKNALARIHAFSLAQNCGSFTGCFSRAMQSLSELSVAHGYHKDLYVPGTLSKSSQSMLDAAQSAWVFGGMGSWNDMGFDGADEIEYEAASEELFTTLANAVCAAANETDSNLVSH